MGIARIGGEDLERGDHGHDLERRTELTCQCRPLAQGGLRLLRTVECDPDLPRRAGASREALRSDRDRTGGTVQETLAGATGEHAADLAAMSGAHNHRIRLGLLGEDVEPMRRRVAQHRLKRQPVRVDLLARLGQRLTGGVRHDGLELLAPAGSRRGVYAARDYDAILGPQLGGQRESVLCPLTAVESDDHLAIHPGSFRSRWVDFYLGTMPGYRDAATKPLSGFPHTVAAS